MIPSFANAVPRRPVDDAKEAHLFGGLWLIAIYKHTHTAAELRRGRMTYILGSIRTYIRTQVWCTCISRVGRRRGDGVAAAAAMRLKQQIRISPAAHLTTSVLMRRTRHYNSNNNNDNNDSTVVIVSVYIRIAVCEWPRGRRRRRLLHRETERGLPDVRSPLQCVFAVCRRV